MDVLRTALQFNGGLFWDTVSYGYTSNGEQSSEIHTHPFTRFSGGVSDTAKENRITSSGSTAGRTRPWTNDELLALAKDAGK